MVSIDIEKNYTLEDAARLLGTIDTTLYKKMEKKGYVDKCICVNNIRYIRKDFIDKILYLRQVSLSTKEAAVLLNRTIDTIWSMLKDKRLSHFNDAWDNSIRIYKEDVDKFLSLEKGYLTAEQLGSIYGITANNIRKKIIYNYCNISEFLLRPDKKKIYVNKKFLEHLRVISSNSILLEVVAKKLDVKQKELLVICSNINGDVLIRDFLTGKFRIKSEYLDYIKSNYERLISKLDENYINLKILLREVVMSETQLKNFALEKWNINIYDKIKYFNNEKYIEKHTKEHLKDRIIEYLSKRLKGTNLTVVDNQVQSKINMFQSQEYFTVEELSNMFEIPSSTIFKKIKKNYCNIKDFILSTSKKTLIKATFIHFFRVLNYNSLFLCEVAKEMDMTQDTLKKICLAYSSNSIFKDFFTGKEKIKTEDLENIKSRYYGCETKYMEKMVKFKSLLKDVSMTESQLQDFAVNKCNINIDEHMQVYNNTKFFSREVGEILKKQKTNHFVDNEIVIKKDYYKEKRMRRTERFMMEEKYFTVNELALHFGISSACIQKRIKKNCSDINNFTKRLGDNRFYIHRDFLDYVIDAGKNSTLLKKVAEGLGAKPKELLNICYSLSENILLKDFVTCENRIKDEKLQEIKNIWLCKTVNNEEEQNESYISILRAANTLGISKNLMKRIITEDSRWDIHRINNELHVNVSCINSIIDILDTTISVNELSSIIGITRQKLMQVCRNENIGLIKHPLYTAQYRILKDKIDVIKNLEKVKFNVKWVKTKEICNSAKDAYDVFIKIKEGTEIKESIQKSADLFMNFTYSKLNNSNSKEKTKYNISKCCGELLQNLNSHLEKEIFLYTNEEIFTLINRTCNSRLIKILRSFLEYCKVNTRCNFTSNYTCSELRKNSNVLENEEIYSLDIWTKYLRNLTDIDKHILKAFDSQRYSCEWLLCILHFVIAWRLNDIVTKIPNIDLEIINIFDFQWFREGNEFTLSMGQKILNQLDLKLSGVCADKNGQELRFFKSLDLIVPISIAYIISEIHRRKNNDQKIFSIFFDRRHDNECAPWVRNAMNNFFVEDNLKGFSNRKANSTLLTYIYECANTMEGMNSISYMLSGAIRSHKNDIDIQLPRTTQIYLKPILHKEDAMSIAHNLIKRGFFGWIPYMLLRVIYDEKPYKEISTYDMTSTIVRLRENINLIGLENLSRHLCCELYERTNWRVFNELIRLDKHELKIRIRSLLTSESTAKTKYGGCLKGRICAYPQRSSCSYCEYFVKNIFFLSELNEEAEELLNIIDDTNESQENELVKHSSVLYKILTIISEAKLFYDNYDISLVESFIDTKSIKKKIHKIQSKLKTYKVSEK